MYVLAINVIVTVSNSDFLDEIVSNRNLKSLVTAALYISSALGPDYMILAGPVSLAASLCRDYFQPDIT